MYETHNPGFCYKRNGDHRVQQPPTVNPPVDFEHLHFLLFTNGEVDIEKVLCLHLLTTHEAAHLGAPKPRKPSSPSTNVVLKKDTPLEQLIERSASAQIDVVQSMVLPTYILDVNKENLPPSKLKDDRLTSRLLVNEKILELITTVITTLDESNPDKVIDLMTIAEDPSSLKRIFRKPHIQNFVVVLKDHSLVSSCSSFVLTQPNKIQANHLEIRTRNGGLEDLIRFIRENVLQLPNHETWRKLRERTSIKRETAEPPPPPKTRAKALLPRVDDEDVLQQKRESKDLVTLKRPTSDRVKRGSNVNYIARNIEEVANYRRSIDTSDLNVRRKKSGDSSRTNTRKREESAVAIVPASSTKSKTLMVSRENSKSEDIKFHLKQTTCPACMEKWKMPLPTPKVAIKMPKYDPSDPTNIENASRSSSRRNSSIQRISTMIEQEQFKLRSYDRKYSNSADSSALNLKRPKSHSLTPKDSLDLVQLDMYDLERIRQEIREKEAQKKLEKFLAAA